MNKHLIYLLLLHSTSILAQSSFTLEEALQPWKTLPIQRPADVAWAENGMPYEAADNQASDHFYATSNDGNYALDFTNRQKVWRYATRGDFYLVNLKTGDKRKLGESLPAASLQFAKFSPDSKRVAYVSKNNIYVERIFMGVRPCVVALILAPCFTMAKSAKITKRTLWIPLVCAILIYIVGVSPIWCILAAGVGGFLYGRITNK